MAKWVPSSRLFPVEDKSVLPCLISDASTFNRAVTTLFSTFQAEITLLLLSNTWFYKQAHGNQCQSLEKMLPMPCKACLGANIHGNGLVLVVCKTQDACKCSGAPPQWFQVTQLSLCASEVGMDLEVVKTNNSVVQLFLAQLTRSFAFWTIWPPTFTYVWCHTGQVAGCDRTHWGTRTCPQLHCYRAANCQYHR